MVGLVGVLGSVGVGVTHGLLYSITRLVLVPLGLLIVVVNVDTVDVAVADVVATLHRFDIHIHYLLYLIRASLLEFVPCHCCRCADIANSICEPSKPIMGVVYTSRRKYT